jgi:hypothetical protein
MGSLVLPVDPPSDLPPGSLPPGLGVPIQAPFDVVLPPSDSINPGSSAAGIAIGIIVALLVLAAVIGLLVYLYKTGRIFAKRVENPDADNDTSVVDSGEKDAMPMDETDPWAEK